MKELHDRCVIWATSFPLVFIDLNPFLFNHRGRISCSSCGYEHELFVWGVCVPGCVKGVQKEIIELFRGFIGVQCYPQVRRIPWLTLANVQQLNSHQSIETTLISYTIGYLWTICLQTWSFYRLIAGKGLGRSLVNWKITPRTFSFIVRTKICIYRNQELTTWDVASVTAELLCNFLTGFQRNFALQNL